MFKTAMLTIDGSETSRRAVPALVRAIEPQTEVTVLEVVDSLQLMLARTTPAGYPMFNAGPALAEQAAEAQRIEAEGHGGAPAQPGAADQPERSTASTDKLIAKKRTAQCGCMRAT